MNIKSIAKKISPKAIIDIARAHRARSHRNKLVKSVSASQVGQDYWVYGEVFNEQHEGFFLDVGAHDGCNLSNTYILERRYNWNGICIEGNPKTYLDLEKNRRCKCINQCVDNEKGIVEFALNGTMGGIVSQDCDNVESRDSQTIQVEARPLGDILKELNCPSTIDYLSIDIEGAEDRALLGFPFDEYVFNCITIERPSDKLRSLLKDYQYILIKEMPGLDCFYIHKSFRSKYIKNYFAYGEKKFRTRRWA